MSSMVGATATTRPSPASIPASTLRTVSAIARSTDVVGSSMSRWPSRSSTRRFSPAWETRSRSVNARNPLVPLMVWMVRNTLLSRAREPGSLSSAMRSLSSWSRFS